MYIHYDNAVGFVICFCVLLYVQADTISLNRMNEVLCILVIICGKGRSKVASLSTLQSDPVNNKVHMTDICMYVSNITYIAIASLSTVLPSKQLSSHAHKEHPLSSTSSVCSMYLRDKVDTFPYFARLFFLLLLNRIYMRAFSFV